MGGKSGPSGTTVTTGTAAPWVNQQPFLQTGFNDADYLLLNYTPSYYPGQTIAPINNLQNDAINSIASLGLAGSPVTSPAQGANVDFLTGRVAAADPATGLFQGLASTNLGENNPGTAPLASYASGSHVAAGNPYVTGLSENILSQVVPSIESQFIKGGVLSSPEAARATAAGATAALAPSLFANYQQEEQNQLNAANTLGSQALTGLGLQEQAGAGLQNAYGQNAQQRLTSLALAPQTQQMPYTDLSQLYGAGATAQALQQAIINDAVQRWNYNTTLPYQQLNQYMGAISGNYGGSTSLTQPFFSNTPQNVLGGALGGGLLGSSIFGPAGLGLASTAGGGAGIGAGLGALMALL